MSTFGNSKQLLKLGFLDIKYSWMIYLLCSCYCLGLVILGEEKTIMNLLVVDFLHHHIISCLLGQKFLRRQTPQFSLFLQWSSKFRASTKQGIILGFYVIKMSWHIDAILLTHSLLLSTIISEVSTNQYLTLR